MAESRQPTEEEVRDFLSRAEITLQRIQDGLPLTCDSDRSVLARRFILVAQSWLAQRDVVAAQDKALRRIAAIKDQHTWSEDDALEAAEIAAAVVSGTPPPEEQQ